MTTIDSKEAMARRKLPGELTDREAAEIYGGIVFPEPMPEEMGETISYMGGKT